MQFTQELARFLPSVARAIRNHKWEQHLNGILLPRERCVIGGAYSYRLNGGDWSVPEPNLLPTEGLNFALDLLGNTGTPAAAYIALYANSTTPIAGHNAAGFTATYGEITSGSEGYTQSTRVVWTAAAAASAAVNNYASAAEFTIISASSLTVNGVALLTASAKGATTGKLISASKFASTKSFNDDDSFEVKYQLSMTSS